MIELEQAACWKRANSGRHFEFGHRNQCNRQLYRKQLLISVPEHLKS